MQAAAVIRRALRGEAGDALRINRRQRGSAAGGLNAIKPQLTWGFRKVFDRLDTMADELRRDRSPAKLSAAVALYHMVIEATLAQPGQHFITSYLEQRDILPAFREGMTQIARDEQRHIAFGVKLLHDVASGDERCRRAVADMLREVTPWGAAVLQPPGWDRNYTEVFGFRIEDIAEEGVVSLQTKLRSAGMPMDELPGPPERLLVWEVGEGWEPLCEFLDVPVPAEPLPHENDRETFFGRVIGGAIGALQEWQEGRAAAAG